MPVLSPKRRVTLPKHLCDQLHVRPGDDLEFHEHNGRLTIIKKTKGSSAGVLKHLKRDPLFSDQDSLEDTLATKHQRHGKTAAQRRAA